MKGGDDTLDISEIHQGDIIIVGFDPSLGHEQRGTRPALVISNHDFTKLTQSLVKVVPISTTSNRFPLHLRLPRGLNVRGVVEIQQETTLDLSARDWKKVDHVSDKFLKEVLEAVMETYEPEQ